MHQKYENIIKIFKKMQRTDFIYLGIVFLFFTITIVLFFYSTSYVTGNVNQIFQPSEKSTIQALDIKRYLLIEKKLSLPINNVNRNVTSTIQ